MASPDLQGHPWKLCLIKYDLNIHVFVSSNCSFSFAISPHFLRLYEAMEKLSELNTYWGNTRKLFQKCMHVLYCSMLSLGGNDTALHWIHFSHKEKSMKYSGHRKLLCELSKLSKLMLLTSSDTRRTLMHLFLFTNSAQRELVSICTQSIHDRNSLSLHNSLGQYDLLHD